MASGPHRFRMILHVFVVWWGALSGLAVGEAVPTLTLAQLRELAGTTERASVTFRLEADVRAVSQGTRLLALDDGTTADILELPSLPDGLRVGDRVVIEGQDTQLARGRLALRLGIAAVVDLDGHHPVFMRTGKVFLQKGMRPLRLEWFNGDGPAALKLEYEAEGVARQIVPAEMFAHATGDGGFEAGLEFGSYEISDLRLFPDFAAAQPERRGVVAMPDLSVRSRQERVGVMFSGFLKVPKSGEYRFFLESDDGARLYLDNGPVTCRVIGPADPMLREPMAWGNGLNQWITLEGTVAYASCTDGLLEMDISRNSDTIHAVVADAGGLAPADLIYRRVKFTGVGRDSGIVTTGPLQVEVLAEGAGNEKVLTKAEEVRRLRPDDPVASYRAAIQGVVTMTTTRSLVIQDATGGVFAHHFSEATGNTPQAGEVWLIEGTTSQGGFSPVIHVDRTTYMGEAPLPDAVQPTPGQLASGSLDAERVEIEGVVISTSKSAMELLTRSGRVRVLASPVYPLITEGMTEAERKALDGGVVRLRGVCRANWDPATGSVRADELMLGNTTLSVDAPAGDDLFSGPLTMPSDLLLFTSHPTALRRVIMRAQVMFVQPPKLWLHDGTSGFRAICQEMPHDLVTGDEVEVSGFPQLGGPSPALQVAVVRVTGKKPLPLATKVPFWELPNAQLDGTRVEIEATVLSDTARQDERELEMRTGSNRFVATLPMGGKLPEKLAQESVLRLTGIYLSAGPERFPTGAESFEMRILDVEDVAVIKRGPWWTGRHTILTVGVLSLGLLLAVAWVSLLRRTVTRRSNELTAEIGEREAAERHRAMEQERTRMAQDLHDELGSGLTEAGILSSLIRNPAVPAEDKQGYLDQLGGLCCSLVTGLDEIVWAVNPRYDSVADLAGYFSLHCQRFLQLVGIVCRLEIEEGITRDALDSRTRQGILLAFKEALNNIARHSEADEVSLTVQVEAGVLVISVVDNGCGFERDSDVPGCDGLRNMQDRIHKLGGRCEIVSHLGIGTTVRFKIPLHARIS